MSEERSSAQQYLWGMIFGSEFADLSHEMVVHHREVFARLKEQLVFDRSVPMTYELMDEYISYMHRAMNSIMDFTNQLVADRMLSDAALYAVMHIRTTPVGGLLNAVELMNLDDPDDPPISYDDFARIVDRVEHVGEYAEIACGCMSPKSQWGKVLLG